MTRLPISAPAIRARSSDHATTPRPSDQLQLQLQQGPGDPRHGHLRAQAALSLPIHDGLIVPLAAVEMAEAALMEAGRKVAKVELALTVDQANDEQNLVTVASSRNTRPHDFRLVPNLWLKYIHCIRG